MSELENPYQHFFLNHAGCKIFYPVDAGDIKSVTFGKRAYRVKSENVCTSTWLFINGSDLWLKRSRSAGLTLPSMRRKWLVVWSTGKNYSSAFWQVNILIPLSRIQNGPCISSSNKAECLSGLLPIKGLIKTISYIKLVIHFIFPIALSRL